MSVLSDSDIAKELAYGELFVDPVDLNEQLQPNSLDIRLGRDFWVFKDDIGVIDVKEGIPEGSFHEYKDADAFVIEPEDFVLATTIEDFSIPDYLEGEVQGRSSIGRLGIEVHSTAGIIDSGYMGEITLEITNNNPNPIKLYSGMRIAQVLFKELSAKCSNPYSSEDNKYQNQEGVQESKIEEDFE